MASTRAATRGIGLPLLRHRFELHGDVVALAPAFVVGGVGGEGRQGAQGFAIGVAQAGAEVLFQRRRQIVEAGVGGRVGHPAYGEHADGRAGVGVLPSGIDFEEAPCAHVIHHGAMRGKRSPRRIHAKSTWRVLHRDDAPSRATLISYLLGICWTGQSAGAAATRDQATAPRREATMNRRRMVRAGLVAGGVLLSRRAASLAAPPVHNEASSLPGTPYPLVALPGKGLLGQVYDIPPNYETPTLRLIGSERYPFTDNAYYYVRHREAVPAQIPLDQFRLQIGGDRVAKPRTLTLDDLRRFPTVELGAVGQCGSFAHGLFRPLMPGPPWSKGDVSCAVWTGASLQAVLEEARVLSGAVAVAFTAAGTTIARKKPKYVQTYPLAAVLQPDAMLAYAMNGQDLPIWNGYPLRVVVPGTFAARWIKQVVTIEIRSTPDPADWAEGPPGEGKLPTYSLITDPPDGTQAPLGHEIALRGVAWDAGQGIARVETSVDGGANWQEATLEPSYGKFVWRVWHQTVQVSQRGQFSVLSRATSVDGATQALDVDGQHWNASRPLAGILLGV